MSPETPLSSDLANPETETPVAPPEPTWIDHAEELHRGIASADNLVGMLLMQLRALHANAGFPDSASTIRITFGGKDDKAVTLTRRDFTGVVVRLAQTIERQLQQELREAVDRLRAKTDEELRKLTAAAQKP